LTYPDYEIVVVDNGSIDGSGQRLKTEFPGCTYIFNEGNAGFSKGCNIGIRYALEAGFPYILLLNNDVVVDAQFIEPLVACCEENPDISMATGKIYEFSNPSVFQSVGSNLNILRGTATRRGAGETDRGQYDRPQEISATTGCMTLFLSDFLQREGLLDESFFFGLEDYEISWRARKRGYKIIYVPQSKIWHKKGVSRKTIDGLQLIYNNYFSKIQLMKKILPRFLWWLWVPVFYLYAKFVSPWRLRNRLSKEVTMEEVRQTIHKVFRDWWNSCRTF